MKLIQMVVLCVSLSLPVSAWAVVQLQLPEKVSIVAINGKNVSVEDRAEFPDGLNQIAIRYVAELGRKFDSERVYSDTFVLLFRAQNTSLIMQIPEITKKQQLIKFNSKPDILILISNGTELDVQISKLNKEGFQLTRDYAKELIVFNQTGMPAAVTMGSHFNQVGQNQPLSVGVSEKILSVEERMAERMLRYWYQQADANTRERFKVWIKQ